MSSFPLLFPWRALTALPISNLLQRKGRREEGGQKKRREKNGMCYKRRMERGKNGEREEWIGGGEEVPGSAFFLPPSASEDARPSVRETNTRAAIICPTSYVMRRLFTRHANLCGR